MLDRRLGAGTASMLRGPAMTLVTMGLASTQRTAKWPAVVPFRAAWSCSFCAFAVIMLCFRLKEPITVKIVKGIAS